MVVAIAGAHGKIALKLIPLLVARGDRVIALIRNPDQAAELRELGAMPAIVDLERASAGALAEAITGADAAVFAAGAGPGSGAERKLTVDRDGAIRLLQASVVAQVARFIIVSAVGAEDPPHDDDVFSVYLRAKAEADHAVVASDRDWTVLRPGRLTDDSGTGRVQLQEAPFRGEIPREDVAAVIAQLLVESDSVGRVLYVNGSDPLPPALTDVLLDPL